MTITGPKRPHIQLDSNAYQELRQQVLRRNGWHCQQCGSMSNLQVHHIQPRAELGDDTENNLITLCSDCHDQVHSR